MAKRQKDLLGVVAQRVLGLQHLPGHEGVEDGRPGQRHAEVEAEEPPVLHRLIELMEGEEKSKYSKQHNACRLRTVIKSHLISLTFNKQNCILLNLPFNSVLLLYLALIISIHSSHCILVPFALETFLFKLQCHYLVKHFGQLRLNSYMNKDDLTSSDSNSSCIVCCISSIFAVCILYFSDAFCNVVLSDFSIFHNRISHSRKVDINGLYRTRPKTKKIKIKKPFP